MESQGRRGPRTCPALVKEEATQGGFPRGEVTREDGPMKLLDSQAVADLIGVELETIYQYKTRGKMPEPYFGGRSPLWDQKAIERWDKRRRKASAGTPSEK